MNHTLWYYAVLVKGRKRNESKARVLCCPGKEVGQKCIRFSDSMMSLKTGGTNWRETCSLCNKIQTKEKFYIRAYTNKL